MAFLSFPCLGQEFAYTSSLASRTLHTAALQRILLACLCLLVCGKEAFAAYVYHFSPRRAALMTLNFATALLLYLGAQALLREPQLHTHEKLKCFLHVLTVLNSQENVLLASGKELSHVAANPILLHVVANACVLVDGIRLRAAMHLQVVFLCSFAVQEAGALMRHDGLFHFFFYCASCALVTGVALMLEARMEETSRRAFLLVRGLPLENMPTFWRRCARPAAPR